MIKTKNNQNEIDSVKLLLNKLILKNEELINLEKVISKSIKTNLEDKIKEKYKIIIKVYNKLANSSIKFNYAKLGLYCNNYCYNIRDINIDLQYLDKEFYKKILISTTPQIYDIKCIINNKKFNILHQFPKNWVSLPNDQFEDLIEKSLIIKNYRTMEIIKNKLNKKELQFLKDHISEF